MNVRRFGARAWVVGLVALTAVTAGGVAYAAIPDRSVALAAAAPEDCTGDEVGDGDGDNRAVSCQDVANDPEGSGSAEACDGEVGNGDGNNRAVQCQAVSNSGDAGDINIIGDSTRGRSGERVAVPGNIGEPLPQSPPDRLAGLPLPAGDYVIRAIIQVQNGGFDSDAFNVGCSLFAGTDEARNGVSDQIFSTFLSTSVPLELVHTFASDGEAFVECAGSNANWRRVRITATEVGTAEKVELTP